MCGLNQSAPAPVLIAGKANRRGLGRGADVRRGCAPGRAAETRPEPAVRQGRRAGGAGGGGRRGHPVERWARSEHLLRVRHLHGRPRGCHGDRHGRRLPGRGGEGLRAGRGRGRRRGRPHPGRAARLVAPRQALLPAGRRGAGGTGRPDRHPRDHRPHLRKGRPRHARRGELPGRDRRHGEPQALEDRFARVRRSARRLPGADHQSRGRPLAGPRPRDVPRQGRPRPR